MPNKVKDVCNNTDHYVKNKFIIKLSLSYYVSKLNLKVKFTKQKCIFYSVEDSNKIIHFKISKKSNYQEQIKIKISEC